MKKYIKQQKKLGLILCFILISLSAWSADPPQKIHFNWTVGYYYYKSFSFRATDFEIDTFKVDWGDGVIEKIKYTDFLKCEHIYSSEGNYDVVVEPLDSATKFTYLNILFMTVLSVDVRDCKDLTVLNCASNQLSTLDVSTCKNLTELNCSSNQLSTLDVSECKALANLSCNANQLLSLNMRGSESLYYLNCNGNKLTSLDISGYEVLISLRCASNPITSLNTSGCKALRELYCYSNQLTSLDLSECESLTSLNCEKNKLISLNLSGCEYLQILQCQSNLLTSLNLNENRHFLLNLNCSSNQLTSLDLSNYDFLSTLDCSSNQLTSLNLEWCDNLFSLTCNSNQLTSLNIQECNQLIFLYCSSNLLSSLDLSKCKGLGLFDCSSNQLTSLDLSKCNKLFTIDCSSNQLNSLVFNEDNVFLERVTCHNNSIPLIDLYNICMKIDDPFNRRLGTQELETKPWNSKTAIIDSVFNGNGTSFSVTLDENTATTSDYTIESGIITFNKDGLYSITMTNPTIAGNNNYPTEVIAKYNVTVDETSATERVDNKLNAFPNPVSDRLTLTGLKQGAIINIYSHTGIVVATYKADGEKMTINMTNLTSGMYFINVNGKTLKTIKK